MTQRPRWILRAHARPGAGLRLLCLPSAGYGGAMYRAWGAALPPDVEVCAVTLPGRETLLGEPPVANLSRLVERIAEEVAPLLDRPFALFGHSMGSWLAYELAQRLEQAGARPARLFASGRRAPHQAGRNEPLHGLDDSTLLAEIQRRYGAIPATVLNEPDLLALMLPALRADLEALETYAHAWQAPLSCPISSYGGLDDAQVPLADLERWRELTAGEFELCRFAGGHFYLQSPSGAALLATLEERLLGILAAAF